jgi:serine phosphatase RsbU (regulator of sigma subunit)
MRKIKSNILNFSLLLCFIFISNSGFSQSQKIDSLKQSLKSAKNDTSLINTYIYLGFFTQKINNDSALFYYNQAKKICKKNTSNISVTIEEGKKSLRNIFLSKLGLTLENIARIYNSKNDYPKSIDLYKEAGIAYTEAGNKLGIAKTYYGIGSSYYDLGETENALTWTKKSLALKEEIGDKKQIISSLTNLGILYAETGKIQDALATFAKSLKLSESINDKASIGSALSNMGILYANQGQKEEALENFKLNLKIREEIGDKKGIAISLENIASIFAEFKKYDTALFYLNKGLLLHTEIKNIRGIVNTLKSIASIHTEKGEFNDANKFLKQCLVLSEQSHNKEFINNSYSGIAKNFIKSKKYNEALNYSEKSFKLSKELGFVEAIEIASEQLQTIYKKLGNYQKALEMFEINIRMRDSLINDENKKAGYKTKLKYEYAKKTLADSIKLADEKKIAASLMAENNAKLKQEKTQRSVLIGGLLLISVFLIFTYNRFKKTQKQKQLIEIQKKIVDTNRKKTIDSINYAKKIQNSILPSKEEIGVLFPNHFILYKPKDIVSGDFYWFHHQNHLSFFAVADCTGHGVPGALMTMIAHSNLIEVVVEQKITEPGKILSALHGLIFKNLQQHKGDQYSQDGMDLSLAIIDHKTKLLHFSGARNNGYLVDGNEIRILKATPKSIGGLSVLGEIEPLRTFKSESFQINKDTLLVLSTDGIFDQLNEEDEKFGNNRFKEMILSLYDSNAEENLNITETTYNNWKGNTPQLDDILLIGIKL